MELAIPESCPDDKPAVLLLLLRSAERQSVPWGLSPSA